MPIENEAGALEATVTEDANQQQAGAAPSSTGDAFKDAFESAKSELRGKKEPSKQAAKKPVQEQPADVEDGTDQEKDEDDGAEEQVEKPNKAKVEAKPDDTAEVAPEEKEPEKKGPLEPKKWWSSRKREAFKFQPKHVQEAWLAEAPQPDQRWTQEQKDAFAKVPREAQEIIIERAQEFERGYGEKFASLANERKLAEEIKAAVPADVRQYLDKRGITEAQAFARLLELQQIATKDPVGYVRKFIVDARINPADIFAQNDQETQGIQPQAETRADVTSHPEFQAMAAKLQQVEEERQKLAEAEMQRSAAELSNLLSERDEAGNPRYPLIRLLAEPIAAIIEKNADEFSRLSTKDKVETAYRQALEDYPEIAALQIAAPQPKVDEPKATTVDRDEEQRAAKLERAVTPKSRTPQPAPVENASGDPFEEAWMSARKQLKR